MKQSVLTLTPDGTGAYHAVFTNNHGRKLYLALSIKDGTCYIQDCHYIDRSTRKVPKKWGSRPFPYGMLKDKISSELDKLFASIFFSDIPPISKKDLVYEYLDREKKHILLLLKDGCFMRSIFKNRYHRSIYLEIKLDGSRALISDCRYCDVRSGERNVPHGLTTVFFDYSLENILRIANSELEGGFCDIAVTGEHTLKLDSPICGRT